MEVLGRCGGNGAYRTLKLADRDRVLCRCTVSDIRDLTIGRVSAHRNRAKQRLVRRVVLDGRWTGCKLPRCRSEAPVGHRARAQSHRTVLVGHGVAAERQCVFASRRSLVAYGSGADSLSECVTLRQPRLIRASVAKAAPVRINIGI